VSILGDLPKRNPSPPRRLARVLAAVTLVALAACGGGGDDEAGTDTSITAASAPAESTTTTEPQPDHTPKTAAIGETVAWKDLQFVVHGTQIPISTEGKLFQPVPGTILVGVDVEVKNPTAETKKFPPALSVHDAQNRAFEVVSAGGVDPRPPTGDILPNGALRGLFVFQVLDGAQGPGLRMVFFPEPEEPAVIVPLVPGDAPPAPAPVEAAAGAAHPVGEAAAVGDGVFVVNGVENPAVPENDYDKPEAGKRFVVIDLSVFNTGKPNFRRSRIDASLQDAQNQTFRDSFKRPKKFPEEGIADLPPGLGRRGPLAFEIPDASAGPGMKLLISYNRSPPVVFQLS
jgi:hypothetical protein